MYRCDNLNDAIAVKPFMHTDYLFHPCLCDQAPKLSGASVKVLCAVWLWNGSFNCMYCLFVSVHLCNYI